LTTWDTLLNVNNKTRATMTITTSGWKDDATLQLLVFVITTRHPDAFWFEGEAPYLGVYVKNILGRVRRCVILMNDLVHATTQCCAECGKDGGVSLKACKACMSVSYCNAT
jgi:hypothetical protein